MARKNVSTYVFRANKKRPGIHSKNTVYLIYEGARKKKKN